MSFELLKNLQVVSLYDHPVTEFEVIETHVSWVLLTGEYAYKIKKPVNFDFLDFSTLSKRKFFCEIELQLGTFFSSELYLSVIPIYGSSQHPNLIGRGEIVEYALKMRQFSQSCLLTEYLKRNELNSNIIEQLAQLIANFHQKTSIAPSKSLLGTPEEVHAPVLQNFEQIRPLLKNPVAVKNLNQLKLWAQQQFIQKKIYFQNRKKNGFIRDCHGDLHLANIIFYQGKPLLFDRVEFNEEFRWIDTMADFAFLVMDLMEKKQIVLANQLLNNYLMHTQDYEGLVVFPYYLTYRAIVRAKISLFRLQQPGLSKAESKFIQEEYEAFIRLAKSYTCIKPIYLIIMNGYSGSGKTMVAEQLAGQLGAIHIHSDVVRKRLFDLDLYAQTDTALNSGIYDLDATERTYEILRDLAHTVIRSGYGVIVDATCLLKKQRSLFFDLAKKHRVPFYIISCEADINLLRDRIRSRQIKGNQLSEARLDILEDQKNKNEEIICDEKQHQILFNSASENKKHLLETIVNLITHSEGSVCSIEN